MFRAKLSEIRKCPSCGWLMRLTTDPDPDSGVPQTDTPHLSVVRFYLCQNRSCEHAEHADRAA
jgi:hypothetical protein